MAYIEAHARDEALLLPASVEDYVATDNPVRFVEAFVDDLDLGDAGCGLTFKPSPTSGATTGPRSRRWSAPSSCCAASSICSGASCWRWTARA